MRKGSNFRTSAPFVNSAVVSLGIWMAGVTALVVVLTFPILADAPSEAFFPWAKGDSWVYGTLNKKKNERFDMKVTMEGPWKDQDDAGMIMTQKDKRGTMREFQLKNEKGIFIQKLALSKAMTPEVNTRFTPAVPRVIFPLTPG